MKEFRNGKRATPFRLALHAALAGAGVTAAVACGALDTNFEDCKLPCEGLCPSGSECRNGYCVHDGSNATCSLDGGVDSSGPVSGSGGARSTGGSGGTSSTGTGGGAATTDGSPESGADVGDVLHISKPASHSLCTGHAGRLSFHAVGGEPPYVWSVSGVPFELAGTDTDELVVTGTPHAIGDYTLDATVTDAANQTAHVTFALHASDPPRVTTTSLPLACANQQYAATLEASGGDPDTYRWDISSLASGITVAGPTLTATMAEAGSTTLTATVSDANCTSDPVELTLQVDAAAKCPRFVQNTLPVPCRANAYPTRTIDVTGGKLPYEEISAQSLPAGITFDPGTRTVGGVSNSDDPLVLQVTDALGHLVQHSYPMTGRDTCWLGFVSTAAAGTTQLHLVDPELWSHRAFPATPVANEPVLDFRFSPDGRYLVYRIASPTGAARLVLMSAPLWEERPLAIEGDVRHYAWSPNSRTLAVSFESGGKGYLGGIKDVSAAVTPGGAPDGGAPEGSGPDGGTPEGSDGSLIRTEADVDSELYWFDDETVGFHSTVKGLEVFHSATMGEGAFESPVTFGNNQYQPDVVVRVVPDGVFLFEPPYLATFWGGFNPGAPPAQYYDGAVEPGGRYNAQIDGTTLQLFQTTAEVYDAVWASTDECTALLAWAPHRDRLACLRKSDTNPTRTVSVIDIAGSATPPLTNTPVSGDYQYLVGDSVSYRRAFSDNGDWFAFTTEQRVYVADLSQGAPYRFSKNVPTKDAYSGPTELAFSPDAHWLLSQRGTTVMLHDLTNADADPRTLTNTSSAEDHYMPLAATACSEAFLENPDAWCGNAHTPASFVWSSDSRSFAARTASETIRAWHVIDAFQIESDTVCTAGCGQLSFQP